MNAAVVDASILGPLLFQDEWNDHIGPLVADLAASDVYVPGHWSVEVGNMLLMGHRRGRISDGELAASIDGLALLKTEIDETGERAWNEVFDLAIQHGLTLYDAAYLELAIRRGAWLASDDAALLNAAVKHGLQVRTTQI